MKELSPCSRSFDFKVLMMSHPPPPIFVYLGMKTELVTVETDATVGIRMSVFFYQKQKTIQTVGTGTHCTYYTLCTVYHWIRSGYYELGFYVKNHIIFGLMW